LSRSSVYYSFDDGGQAGGDDLPKEAQVQMKAIDQRSVGPFFHLPSTCCSSPTPLSDRLIKQINVPRVSSALQKDFFHDRTFSDF
jgi:hypothetical protein